MIFKELNSYLNLLVKIVFFKDIPLLLATFFNFLLLTSNFLLALIFHWFVGIDLSFFKFLGSCGVVTSALTLIGKILRNSEKALDIDSCEKQAVNEHDHKYER